MPFPKYETAIAQRNTAIKENLDVFRKQLDRLAEEHRGEYVLIREKKIVGFYQTAADALQAAMHMYPNDARYSVQKIEPEPICMGMYADVVVGSRS